mmetsp:Transcript_7184/g.5459  ORF Transcript_7184/g.5459 Transcript_7184/m.5459 type:complete len:113 (+) Transcript_7184:327-665(+)
MSYSNSRKELPSAPALQPYKPDHSASTKTFEVGHKFVYSPSKTYDRDDSFDLMRELEMYPTRRYDLAFLKELLDKKMDSLLTSIKEKQVENFGVEEEVLGRLSMLKSLNEEI